MLNDSGKGDDPKGTVTGWPTGAGRSASTEPPPLLTPLLIRGWPRMILRAQCKMRMWGPLFTIIYNFKATMATDLQTKLRTFPSPGSVP